MESNSDTYFVVDTKGKFAIVDIKESVVSKISV